MIKLSGNTKSCFPYIDSLYSWNDDLKIEGEVACSEFPESQYHQGK